MTGHAVAHRWAHDGVHCIECECGAILWDYAPDLLDDKHRGHAAAPWPVVDFVEETQKAMAAFDWTIEEPAG